MGTVERSKLRAVRGAVCSRARALVRAARASVAMLDRLLGLLPGFLARRSAPGEEIRVGRFCGQV